MGNMETWFLLYDGDSPDGMGDASYIGRTLCAKDAEKHHLKCKSDPYSTGFVVIITDNQLKHSDYTTDWNSFISI